MVFYFLDEIQPLLFISSDRGKTLAECLHFIKHFMSFTDGLVDLLDGVLDVKLSGYAMCSPIFPIPPCFNESSLKINSLPDLVFLELNDVISVLSQRLFHSSKGIPH